jgi:hypothetical protein
MMNAGDVLCSVHFESMAQATLFYAPSAPSRNPSARCFARAMGGKIYCSIPEIAFYQALS